MFGIPKPGQMVEDDDKRMTPALRLIMNLQPINGLMKAFAGDIHTHSRLRREWSRLFAFNIQYTAAELGVEDNGKPVYIGSQVVPMG
eukprot:750349-Amphidinium_carterae.2